MSDDQQLMAIRTDAYADVCDTVSKICSGFPAAYWRGLEDRPKGEGYPEEFVAALEHAGIMAAMVPEEFGGVGLPLTAVAAIAATINATGCNGAVFVAQAHLIAIIASLAGDSTKKEILGKIANGKARLQTLAVSETGAGDDISQMTTTVRRTDTGLVLSGRKSRACNASVSSHIVVLARSDTAEGTALIVVDTAVAPSGKLVIEPFEEMNNDGGAAIQFDELPLGTGHLLGQFGDGAKHLEELAVVHSILVAAAAIGDGRFFSRRGVAYANERVVFGNLIGKYQGIQFPLAKAQIELEAGNVQMLKAATLYDQGADASGASMVAKHLAVEAAWAMADAAFTTHGGFAFAREYDIERKWRDVRAARVAATSFKNELSRIAENMLGLPRSY